MYRRYKKKQPNKQNDKIMFLQNQTALNFSDIALNIAKLSNQ